MSNVIIEQEKLDALIKATIDVQNENAILKMNAISLNREMEKLIKIKNLQEAVLNQYTEYNQTLASEINKLKNYITENFEEFNSKKDDVDIDKDFENLSNREDLSSSFVGSNGELYTAQSIFDISILLLKKLKMMKDKGYDSF